MAKCRPASLPPPPWLKRVWLDAEAEADWAAYPWCLPLFRQREFELRFERPVTILAGENVVGKSTLLEAVAVLAGFDESGGGPGYRAVDNSRALERSGGALAASMKASWLPRMGQGWFFRAESFFSVARYLDEVGSPSADYLRTRTVKAFCASSRNAARGRGCSCSTSPNRRCRLRASSIFSACSTASARRARHRSSWRRTRRS